ncbi:MAG TPA: orotidine-5'-phosphate decarboxylase [Steroidobacteraceae bacterium]
MTPFPDRLGAAWARNDSLVCIGLDPEIERFPRSIASSAAPILEFNKAIIEATADLVCAYKPQFAHYAAYGAEGELERTIDYIHQHHPGIPVVLDAKRGDVGNTAKRYASEAFERYGADAVTVNPYLGFDSLEPFLAFEDRGTFVLCRTSNPGARDLQDLSIGGPAAPGATTPGASKAARPLYQVVAEFAATSWNARGNCGLVVGATYPAELGEVRAIVGDMPLLVPGVGAQGGDIEQAIRHGRTRSGRGLLVSSSRAILYASSGEDFAAAARGAAQSLRETINRLRVRP